MSTSDQLNSKTNNSFNNSIKDGYLANSEIASLNITEINRIESMRYY